MQYQSDGTQVNTRPAPAAVSGTPGWVTGGTPGIQDASDDDSDVMNQILDELCGLVVAAGIALSKTDSTQVLQAIQTLGRRMVTFTSTSNWTAPTGTYRIKLRIWGGGGGGGNGNGGGGGGGAAGGYFEGYASVVPGTTYTVTVGALGYPGAAAGGTSSFGSIASASGGSSGSNGPNGAGSTAFGTGTGTGRASLGQSGQNGVSTSSQITGGQGGGVVDYNGGAAQPVGAGGNAAGNNGQIGCGGSGGAGTGNGGNGGAGLVIVEY